ncbi:homoserine kinase [Terrihabitans rhizophilus]|uniref:Homoserine kinase n=1 Tax=Terrihabitans rhizophilus TaxID=3092662 RepID=A0ABU4RRU5_9HYPH|nr:homoserine kinase [Terrihabitans sp. PJ23]MDX6807326.1 homoserine kinase [Terrihabitans sp. PJ23]
MAVYTSVPEDDLAHFLAGYDIGQALACKGIAEGVENSNFLLRTETGPFILTLYEKRVDRGDLPFFLGLMEHCARNGIRCPLPVRDRTGEALGMLCGRPAAIVTFLDGMSGSRLDAEHCAEAGEALARLHVAARDFPVPRPNALSFSGWDSLAAQAGTRADSVEAGLSALISTTLDDLRGTWPDSLPRGVIHADLFPDNVLFLSGRTPGIIDFYFACTDMLAYDLAICINAWCFDAEHRYDAERGQALISAYDRARPLEADEIAALPVLCRGAALRFLLTRLVDWLSVPEGALVQPKDPREYSRKLEFHRGVSNTADYGWSR